MSLVEWAQCARFGPSRERQWGRGAEPPKDCLLTGCDGLLILISMGYRSITEEIRVWREKRGLSQRALAKAAGISPVLVTKIESRAIVDPRLSTLRKLAKALNVRVADLIGEGKPARKRARGKSWTPRGHKRR